VRRGPPKGDELEQVRNTSHRRHEHVGEREEEAEKPSKRTGSRSERGEERDRRHRERRPDRVISGCERHHRQSKAQSSRDQRQSPRDSGRTGGAGRGDDDAGEGGEERSPELGQGSAERGPGEEAARHVPHEVPGRRRAGRPKPTPPAARLFLVCLAHPRLLCGTIQRTEDVVSW